jgi:hypothetical protein
MPRLERAWKKSLALRSSVTRPARRLALQLPLFDLLVLCCACFRLQLGHGRWTRHAVLAADYPNTTFSHGICPACLKQLYPDFSGGQCAEHRPRT